MLDEFYKKLNASIDPSLRTPTIREMQDAQLDIAAKNEASALGQQRFKERRWKVDQRATKKKTTDLSRNTLFQKKSPDLNKPTAIGTTPSILGK